MHKYLSINFVTVFFLVVFTYSVELSKCRPRAEIKFLSSITESRSFRCLNLRGGGIELPGGLQYLEPMLQQLARDSYPVNEPRSSSSIRQPSPRQSASSDAPEHPRSELDARMKDNNDEGTASGNAPAEEEESEFNVEPLGYEICREVGFPHIAANIGFPQTACQHRHPRPSFYSSARRLAPYAMTLRSFGCRRDPGRDGRDRSRRGAGRSRPTRRRVAGSACKG